MWPRICLYKYSWSHYSSSTVNDDIDDLERTLSLIESRVIGIRESTIIAGDYNASLQWGMPVADRRGDLVTEWAATNTLTLLNRD